MEVTIGAAEANARLMAAAPELLWALEQCWDFVDFSWDETDSICDKVREILKKARGEK